MTFHIYRDAKGEWRWRLVRSNGRIMADSGEGYTRRQGVMRAIATLQETDLKKASLIEVKEIVP